MPTAAANEWLIGPGLKPERRARLTNSPDSGALCDLVAHEAEAIARAGGVIACWELCKHDPTLKRVVMCLPISPPTFDLLFNGRSGYRAHYYIGQEAGIEFNRRIISRLVQATDRAWQQNGATDDAGRTMIRRSLLGEGAKIWAHEDWALYAYPDDLLAPRWCDYWNSRRSCTPMGLKLPLLDEPVIDLKGVFVDPKSERTFVTKDERSRAKQIHESGWT